LKTEIESDGSLTVHRSHQIIPSTRGRLNDARSAPAAHIMGCSAHQSRGAV